MGQVMEKFDLSFPTWPQTN